MATISQYSASTNPSGRRSSISWWRTPVMGWASFTAVYLAFAVWVMARWLIDGGFRPVPHEFTISSARRIILWAWQVVIVLWVVTSSAWIIHRCRREHRLTFDAIMMLGFTAANFIFPVVNYFSLYEGTSSATVTVRSWGPYIPGWHGGPHTMNYDLFAASGFAFSAMIAWFWLARFILGRVAACRPQWHVAALAATSLIINVVLNAVLFLPFTLSGVAMYFGDNGAALFAADWYQLPVSTIVGTSLAFTVFALVDRAFRVEGEDVAMFRGCHRLPSRFRSTARILAGMGLPILGLSLAFILDGGLAALVGTSIPLDAPSHLLP